MTGVGFWGRVRRALGSGEGEGAALADDGAAVPGAGGAVVGMAAVEPVVVRDTPNYRVTYYGRGVSSLVIVFISAGRAAPGQPVEEFKKTLDGLGSSVVFVLDRHAHWFNHAETAAMWAELDGVARRYARVATIGDSMGASGAIIANQELSRVERTLAFAPQYSIAKPFIDFDDRYERVSRQVETHYYVTFAPATAPAGCVLVYGNLEWRDYLHSAMFALHGLAPIFVDGVSHNVATELKAMPGNRLMQLVRLLLDWERPFDRAAVVAALDELVTTQGVHAKGMFGQEAAGFNGELAVRLADQFAADTGGVLGGDLARRRPATQSSLSQWSRGSTKEEDAGGAVAGWATGQYSFHTDYEAEPWWMVDLGRPCTVQEIRIFNYMAEPAVMVRSSAITISFSDDGAAWVPVFERTEAAPFGGSNGQPLVWRAGPERRTRFVRVGVRGSNYLHLDQVQVFGEAGAPG